MEYGSDVQLDQSRVRYGGGSGGPGGGGRLAVGGGLGGLVVLVLVTLLGGGNVTDLLSGVATETRQDRPGSAQPVCRTSDDLRNDRSCRWVLYENVLRNYWASAFTQGFKPADSIQVFSGRIGTACGTGSSEMGPFYCPADTRIYIDDEFMGQLLRQLGTTRSDAAELYITAHEYGHHVSNLTGAMRKARASGNQTGPRSAQVRLELQADCYAGVFFANANKDPKGLIKSVSQDDLTRVADAARAVGDDHIQQQQGGRVVPESWTHGSSRMRQYWVTKGFQSGDPDVCDTFSTDDLGG